LIVDELAHTNAAGDDEVLYAGGQDIEAASPRIDVYTTVSVQHLESLNDVVAKITGVIVAKQGPRPSSSGPTKSNWSICLRRPDRAAGGRSMCRPGGPSSPEFFSEAIHRAPRAGRGNGRRVDRR
jgi:hypothetical protein